MDRRRFMHLGLASGALAAYTWNNPLNAAGFFPSLNTSVLPDLEKKITSPVIIQSVELIKVDKNYFVVTTSKEGVKGIVKTNGRQTNLLTLFKKQVAPFFIDRDARHLEKMIEEIYLFRRNYKYAGMPLWNSIAHAELSILDLLGKTTGQPVNQLIGTVLRSEIPVYMSSTERGTTAQEEVDWVGERIRATGSKAAKLKIGGRMSKNKDVYPGRSEDLIKLSRETWGDDFVLYFDANGSYDVPKAIEMGKLLQDYGVKLYEEPVPWEDFYSTKLVNDALDMIVAGGEQDSSMPKWEWMINNKAFDLVQPDIFYNGGMIRTLQVARLAQKAGIQVTLHSPKNDTLASYMLHFASITENIGPYQEFRAEIPKDEGYYTPKIKVIEGKAKVPAGAGFGIEYDPDYLKKGKVI